MLDTARTRTVPARARARDRAEALAALRGIDWILMLGAGALVAYGLWAIAGITRHDVEGQPSYFVLRQAVAAALGTAGMVGLMLVPPRILRRLHRVLFYGVTGLIGVVLLLGAEARGSRRWIDLGVFQLQPSEIGKLVFVLGLAGWLAERHRRTGEWGTVLRAVGFAAPPMALVFVQPDLGTTLVYAAALAAALFVAGTRWGHLALLGAVTAAIALAVLWLLPAAGVQVLKPYQTARLTAFADPGRDPGGSTYNVSQSMTAVGAGGLDGRGVEGATQTKLNYLPEHATDFAFASLAEQRGFVGASVLLLLYLLVLWRGLRIVSLASDAFGAIVAGSLVFALLFQIFVNVGMTMGIAPITGIPLPFVSVGGSSLLTNLLFVGVLQSIHARSRQERR